MKFRCKLSSFSIQLSHRCVMKAFPFILIQRSVMDFGSLADLDDSLFESKKKEVVKISLKSYNAKFCEPYVSH